MTKKPISTESVLLRKKVAKLEAEVEDLRQQVELNATPAIKRVDWWRSVTVWSSIALSTALLVAGNILFWTGNTIVKTDRYVAAVGPLIEKPEIQTALATYTTDKVFDNVDVESYVQTALPEKIQFLAPQLTVQLKSQTQKSITKILGNPKVQDYWYESLERRHSALINFSKNYEGDGTIEVSDIYSQLSKQLSATKLSFLANKELPPKVGSVKVATAGWLPILHKVSNRIDIYRAVAIVLLVIFSALAIFVSVKRRKTVIVLSLYFAAFMALTLLSVYIAKGFVTNQVDPQYRSAARVAYDTILHSFNVQTTKIMFASLSVALVAWLSGKYDWVSFVRAQHKSLVRWANERRSK